MQAREIRAKVLAAQNLLVTERITRDTFESVRTLLRGINPQLDEKFAACSKALSAYGKLEKGEVVELAIEYLPEETEEEKKRKRALLLFINSWKDLRSEVERVKSELESSAEAQSPQEQLTSFSKIIATAKGPLGIITIAAVVIVGGLIVVNANKPPSPQPQVQSESTVVTPSKQKIQVIEFNGKRIAVSELIIAHGPECDGEHYHANDHVAAKALDSNMVSDPGGCGFGKVKDVRILEVEQ